MVSPFATEGREPSTAVPTSPGGGDGAVPYACSASQAPSQRHADAGPAVLPVPPPDDEQPYLPLPDAPNKAAACLRFEFASPGATRAISFLLILAMALGVAVLVYSE